jgi:hypothetical protein
VGPGAGLDRCGKSRPTGIRSPDLPARRESLYRLSYPGSLCVQLQPARLIHFALQEVKVKVKQSRNKPGVAQRVPGGLGSQIFTTFGT